MGSPSGAELSLWESTLGDTWQERLEPLESTVRSLAETEFLTRDRPIRVGTHGNSAFALTAISDYAQTIDDQSLAAAAAETARRFYREDTAYPVEYEPLGWDFVSPALTEADLMRRVLAHQEFVEWIEQFFPELTQSPFRTILEPLDLESSLDDGVATHLIGLNISKAWCLVALSEVLEQHRYGDLLAQSAKRHVNAGREPALTDDYAGSYWLSSFVLYLLTRNEGGIEGR